MVHEVARKGFGSEAGTYERSRPSYPPPAIAFLVEQLGLRPGAVVLDLAAGTGKLTRLLVPTGASVMAVEPVAGMRAVLRQVAPAVPTVAGTAEALPLRTASLDAACVAQAFHWFDAGVAFGELARVLRGGGRLAVVGNVRDRSLDWVAQVWSIMDEVETAAPWRSHEGWRAAIPSARPTLVEVGDAAFHHEQVTTPEGVVDRIRGVSHVAALPPAGQAAVLDRVRRLLDTHPDTKGRTELRIPYRTQCWVAQRKTVDR